MLKETLDDIQASLYNRAEEHLKKSMVHTEDWTEFLGLIGQKKLVKTYFCGAVACEDQIKDKTGGATSRCIPLDSKEPEDKKCVHCGKKATAEVYFSKNY